MPARVGMGACSSHHFLGSSAALRRSLCRVAWPVLRRTVRPGRRPVPLCSVLLCTPWSTVVSTLPSNRTTRGASQFHLSLRSLPQVWSWGVSLFSGATP